MSRIKYVMQKVNTMSQVKKATFVFLICSVFQKSVSIISTPIFSRLMTTEQYGQFSMYQTWLSLFSIITTFRLDYDVFNKGMAKYPHDRENYLASMQTLTSIITIVCFGVYLLFSEQINSFTELPSVVIVAIFIELFFMPAMSFWTLKERYGFKYKSLLVLTVCLSVFNIVIGVIATIFTPDEKGVARIISCVMIQAFFGFILYCRNYKKSTRRWNKEYVIFAIIFNIPLIPHYFASYILSLADRVMIQKMQGISEAGIYSLVYNVGLVMTMFSSALNNALIPWQYRSLQEKSFENLNRRVKSILIILASAIIVFMVFAPDCLRIMASEEYYEGVYVIPPVAASVFFIFLYNLICNAEFFYDKNKFTMVMSGVCAGLNIILNAVFIKLFGYVAAGYTTLFCYVLTVIFHFIYANKVSQKNVNLQVYKYEYILIISLVVILATVISSLLYAHTAIRYFVISFMLLAFMINAKKVKNVVLKILR